MAESFDSSRGAAYVNYFASPANNRYDDGKDSRGRDHIRRTNIPADHIGPGMVWNHHQEEKMMGFGQRGPRGQTQWPGDTGVLGTDPTPPRRPSHWRLDENARMAAAAAAASIAEPAAPDAGLPSPTPLVKHPREESLVELCEGLDSMTRELRQRASERDSELLEYATALSTSQAPSASHVDGPSPRLARAAAVPSLPKPRDADDGTGLDTSFSSAWTSTTSESSTLVQHRDPLPAELRYEPSSPSHVITKHRPKDHIGLGMVWNAMPKS